MTKEQMMNEEGCGREGGLLFKVGPKNNNEQSILEGNFGIWSKRKNEDCAIY